MTLREKIGQTVIARQNLVTQESDLRKHICENPYGGIYTKGNLKAVMDILVEVKAEYKPNSGDYRKWFNKLNSYINVPILVGIDAEDGARNSFGDLSATGNAAEIGATNTPELAFEYGVCVARELKCAGVNWCWRPVMDLTSRHNAASVGRAFSDDVELLIKMGCEQIKGMQSQKVAATVKHFPGPGIKEYRDSHITHTVNDISLEEWKRTQGKVFQAAIDAGAYSVMVGHMGFPSVDNSSVNSNCVPSTLSYKIVTELLKEKMGFSGVVVTDGLAMTGLSAIYPNERLYVELLKAGNDAILGPTKPDYINIVEEAVLSGKLSEERINDACMRILKMKEKLGLFSKEECEIDDLMKEKFIRQTSEMNTKVAENAITLVSDKNSKLPLKQNEIRKIAIICSTHSEDVFNELGIMKEEFENRGANVLLQRRLTSLSECEKITNENDLIVYAAYLAPFRPSGGSHFYGDEHVTFTYAFSYGKEKSIGVSLGSPYIYYDYFSNSDVFVNAYWYNKETQKTFVAAIYGEIPFRGVSPFKLIP